MNPWSRVVMDDNSLVAAARQGSTEALGQLFDRHWPDAWRAAFVVTGRRDVADDVAQDAFVRAIRGLPMFDEGRPFGPWFRRIAVNRALDVLRSERRMVELDERWGLELEDHEPDVDLVGALRRLGWERRSVVVLDYWLGYGLRDIGEMLDVPVGTVSSRLSRALVELRVELEATHG